MGLSRWVGRAIGLDVHRDFCVVAICEEGEVRTGARVPSTPEGLAVFAESLLASWFASEPAIEIGSSFDPSLGRCAGPVPGGLIDVEQSAPKRSAALAGGE